MLLKIIKEDTIDLVKIRIARDIGLTFFKVLTKVRIRILVIILNLRLLIYKINVSFELLGIFFGFLVFAGMFIFLFYNVHYFVLLLRLEIILLGVTFFLIFCFGSGFDLVSVFFFLLLMACIGGFRISLLVFLFRRFGKDFWFGAHLF